MELKKRNKILNKIIDLTKSVYLKEPLDDSRSTKFLAGKSPWHPLLGSFSMEWWTTERSSNCCEDIADMAISSDTHLHGGDRESFCEIINLALRENANNSELFNVDKIFFQQAHTLFEARAIADVQEFSLHLWNEIHSKMKRSLANWLILYPLHKVKAQSSILEFDGLSLLASNDSDRWQELSEKYRSATLWNPTLGIWKDQQESFRDFLMVPTWLVCEVSGTATGARNLAARHMRTFLSVLFSYLDEQNPNLLTKSGAEPAICSIQFPSEAAQVGQSWIRAGIGRLLPPLILHNGLEVSEEAFSEVRNWYLLRASSADPISKRATTASHFVHYAIVADGLERFVHFFIALDALFGERYKVETNITEGIKQTFSSDASWETRIEKLFALRNDLVHGGISTISDWKELDSYRKCFKSHPLQDVKLAAMTALTRYFGIHSHLF